jgi:hypothetical protein
MVLLGNESADGVDDDLPGPAQQPAGPHKQTRMPHDLVSTWPVLALIEMTSAAHLKVTILRFTSDSACETPTGRAAAPPRKTCGQPRSAGYTDAGVSQNPR